MTLGVVLVAPTRAVRADDRAEPERSPPAPASEQRLATALDLGLYLAIGTAWYILDQTNERDREYDWSFATLKKKFVTREAFRFDDNTFGVNAPGHPIAGSLYFLSARSHGGNSLEAFAIASAGSAVWELGIEFQEVLSINDVITTSMGGAALGESFFQIGEFFRRAAPTPLNAILGTVLMGATPFLPWDHREPRTHHAFGASGYPVDMWHRIYVGAGVEMSRASAGAPERAAALLDAGARVIDLADYGRVGTTDPTWLGRSLRADFHVRGTATPSGAEGLWLSAEAIWSGAYGRTLRADGGGLHGVEWLAGPSAIYDYQQRSVAAGRDRIEAVSPIGASGHAAVHLGASQLRFDASLHPVFAAVHSHAWEEIAGAAPEVPPAALGRDGYYFSLGARAALAAALEWGGWRLGASARAYALSSAEWMEVPAHASSIELADQRVAWEASIARDLAFGGMLARIALRNDAHWSRAQGAFVDGARPSMVLQLEHEL